MVVALAAGLCFHLHCGSTPGGGSHRVLLRTVSWWNYRTVGDKVDWSEGRSCRGQYVHVYPIFAAGVRKSLNMRLLRVGGVVSPRTLAISYSVSDGEGCFE